MQTKEIYKKRFQHEKKRIKVWKILVDSFFSEFINPEDTVLDIGSGYCEFINAVKCKKKYALDVNTEIKKYAASGVTVLISKSTKIRLKDNSVDKVFISNFFEHITKDEIVKTIGEIKRVLRNKGKVIAMHPNIRFLGKDFWMFFDHITPIDDRAIEEIFLVNDFSLDRRILKFLPFTMSGGAEIPEFLIKIYLKIPLFWVIFGKQSLLVFKKNEQKA